jgi:hypothetical protein
VKKTGNMKWKNPSGKLEEGSITFRSLLPEINVFCFLKKWFKGGWKVRG